MNVSLDPLANSLPGGEGVWQLKDRTREHEAVTLPSLEFPRLSVYKQVGVGFLMSGVSELLQAANPRLTSNI